MPAVEALNAVPGEAAARPVGDIMRKPPRAATVGSLESAVRRMNSTDAAGTGPNGTAADRLDRQRRLLAEVCRMLDPRADRSPARRSPSASAGANGAALVNGKRLS